METSDITGQKFNKLTAIRFDRFSRRPGKNKGNYHYWIFKCDCGNYTSTIKQNVVRKNSTTTSCGCVNTATRKRLCRERKLWLIASKHTTIHGLSGSRFGKVYNSIKQRCTNPKNKKYHIYGGAGIKCEWDNLINFRDDMYDSYLKHITDFGQSNTTIDRVNGCGNYCKKNCRWATYKEQNNNLKSNVNVMYQGEKMCISELSRRTGFPIDVLRYRLKKYNNDVKLAIENPVKFMRRS